MAFPTPPASASTPLAYDLMEPFRPCVDWRIVEWLQTHRDATEWEVTKEFKRWVTAFAIERVDYLGFNLEIQGCIEGVVRGFRRAVLERQVKYYRPWTPKDGRWLTAANPTESQPKPVLSAPGLPVKA